MNKKDPAVRLLKNKEYPTYQLYAKMANRKTNLDDGLRYGALTVIGWLCHRLGENAPTELSGLDIKSYNDKNLKLKSYYIIDGYSINIISIPDEGIWSLQLIEPDLSSDPGKENPITQAVPGRSFVTNIAFRIYDDELECAFQTKVLAPKNEPQKAKVYRLAIIRYLMEAECFGLRQLTELSFEPKLIKGNKEYKEFCDVVGSEENYLPSIVFIKHKRKIEDVVKNFTTDVFNNSYREPLKEEEMNIEEKAQRIAKKKFSFARIYVLGEGFSSVFERDFGVKTEDVLVFNPRKFGGKIVKTPYDNLDMYLLNYPKDRINYYFGNVMFVPEARRRMFELKGSNESLVQVLQDENSQLIAENSKLKEKCSVGDIETFNQMQNEIKISEAEIIELEKKVKELEKKNGDLIMQADTYKREKSLANSTVRELEIKLNESSDYKQITELKNAVKSRFEIKEYPSTHKGIVNYFERVFSDRIIFSEGAKKSLDKCNMQFSDLWKLLYDMVTILWFLKFEDKNLKNLDMAFNEKSSFELKLKAGMMTEKDNSKIREYTTEYKGESIDIQKHITFKIGKGQECQGVYFNFLDDEKRILIGHCGEHKSTYRGIQ